MPTAEELAAFNAMNGSTLFGRLCRLTITKPSGTFSDTDPTANAIIIGGSDSTEAPGLRITAKVVKTQQKEPNTSEICVYNLAPTTRGQLQQKGVRLILEAGYAGTGLSLLFVGDVRTVDHVRDGADWKTVLKCGDGERSIRFARASESFAAGSTVAQVVKHCADAMGLAQGNVGAQLPALSTPLYQGWTAHGAASSELDRVLRAVGYSYSVQDGQLQILAPGQSLAQVIPDLNPDTGLIGSPEMGSPEKAGKPQTLKFRSLLIPEARCGGRVRVRSERYNGVFRTRKVVHDLDTMGGPWYSEFESINDPGTAVA